MSARVDCIVDGCRDGAALCLAHAPKTCRVHGDNGELAALRTELARARTKCEGLQSVVHSLSDANDHAMQRVAALLAELTALRAIAEAAEVVGAVFEDHLDTDPDLRDLRDALAAWRRVKEGG